MKSKQIEKLLLGVYNNFVASITDEDVKDIILKRSFISGGCIPSMLTDEWVNDYDVYFIYKSDIDKVRVYFENTHTREKEDKYHVNLITENAINLSDKIQLITKFYGPIDVVTSNFDWEHIKSYFHYVESLKKHVLCLTDNV